MSFQDGVWKWWRHATHPDDFDQRFEGTLSEDGKTIESAISSKTASGSTTSTSPTRGPSPKAAPGSRYFFFTHLRRP